ncbi:hypothetical protein CF328_g5664 [Tilletia controversa]|nr:hypothetical protein CF328_g5664 [Tilletia controversa]
MGFITDPRKFDSVIANIFSSPVSSSVSESGPSRRLFQRTRRLLTLKNILPVLSQWQTWKAFGIALGYVAYVRYSH